MGNTIATANLTGLGLGSSSDRDVPLVFSELFPGADVEVFAAGQGGTGTIVVDIDSDTAGFNSFIRLFDEGGNELAFNDDGQAPDESTVDNNESFLTFRVPGGANNFDIDGDNAAGDPDGADFFIGVSNQGNQNYDPITGAPTGGGLSGVVEAFFDISIAAFDSKFNADDLFIGSEGDDAISASDEDNGLAGFAGDDLLEGNGGDDEILGGEGDDTLAGNADNDTLFGEEGNDLLFGGDDEDVLSGGIGNDTVRGGADNDNLNGDEGEDVVSGESGDDVADGGDGNDTVYGGGGNDTLLGGEGDDELFGGLQDDNLSGGAGNDTVRGGPGDDTLSGNGGDDLVSGEAGDDVVRGNGGDDTLFGGSGEDRLLGGADDDMLNGGADDDELTGGTGDDTLVGGAGADTLIGTTIAAQGSGEIDVLTGGSGADTFVLADEATSDLFYTDQNSGDPFLGDFALITDLEIGVDTVIVTDPINLGAGEQYEFVQNGNNLDLRVADVGAGATEVIARFVGFGIADAAAVQSTFELV